MNAWFPPMAELLMQSARLVAIAALLWANAFVAAAGGARAEAPSDGGGPFAEGYVICTPNGLVTISFDEVDGAEPQPQPADGAAGPICPECVLGAGALAASPSGFVDVALSQSILRYGRASAPSPLGAPRAAYRSRAPPL
ncbi:MAG: hypothetical protein AAGF90_17030 [Pseudomonadota bacterium]